MESIPQALQYFEKHGYDKNIVLKFDHFEIDSGKHKLFPQDFVVDDVFRYENTSDPEDQAILYAISCPNRNLKGVFMEGYGIYQESVSQEMLERLKQHPH